MAFSIDEDLKSDFKILDLFSSSSCELVTPGLLLNKEKILTKKISKNEGMHMVLVFLCKT